MHVWDTSPAEMISLQRELAAKIVPTGAPTKIGLVAGIDVSTGKADSLGHCCIVVLGFPGLEQVDESYHSGEVGYPYVPGLLSFREGPLFLRAFEKLKVKPDILIFDGHGTAHPRRFGIASHMGLWLGMPSIGCAKSRLCGKYEEPGTERGSTSPLLGADGERIGTVLRTRSGIRPVFVSPGHLVGMDESVEIVLACTGKYRVPIPTRMAHIRAGEKRISSGL